MQICRIRKLELTRRLGQLRHEAIPSGISLRSWYGRSRRSAFGEYELLAELKEQLGQWIQRKSKDHQNSAKADAGSSSKS
jgi:hypothetical protein